jgi:DNA-binding GntR family transcriptional regulator
MTRLVRSRPRRSANDPTTKGKGPPIDRLFDAVAEKTKTRTEAVHGALRQAIIEQRLKPGTKLTEEAIGDAFGSSRTIAREALGRLAVEGIVELKLNRGAFVANPSLEEGEHISFVRRGLERLVTESLSGRLRSKEIGVLRDFVAREQAAAHRDSKEAIRLAGEFHIVLARMTGNGVLFRYVNEVVCRCSLILAMYARPHSAEGGASEHGAIIEALARGEGRRASQLMDDHIAAVARRAFLSEEAPRDDLRGLLAPYAARLRD